ncbi:hypothetical protein [uncultured Microbulbifer sp.]|uniref:hypothetical protein n=1 Tax=uncultured Microbulbifer sp. TaxID=348147 RepID=UPI0026397D70|nr:hypothetical protein [uncultured Microbulbifer sp.]
MLLAWRNKQYIRAGSSWLNLVERLFGLIKEKNRYGIFTSVKVLEKKTLAFVDDHSTTAPKLFIAEIILGEIERAIEHAKAALF